MGQPNARNDGRFRTGLVVLLSGAHFIHDVFTAFLPPLLPLLIAKHGLSLTQAGSLATFLNTPSIVNPFLGALADRRRLRKILVIVGPGSSGTLLCLMGLAPTYGSLAIVLLAAGCSVAALHVGAPVMIGRVAGERVGRGMGIFAVAGELARTTGPLIAVQIVSTVGLEGMWQVIPLAVASSLLLWWRLGRIRVERPDGPPSGLLAVWREMRFIITAVSGILMARAFMVGALTTFLPTFVYEESGSLWMATASLSILQLAGALGAFVTGNLSDRIGRRRTLLACVLLSPPLLVLFLLTGGLPRLAVIAALGFVTLSTHAVLLAVTLENSGANPAAASGTYMMIAFAARSLIILAVGAMADAFGLRAAYFLCAAFAALGVPFVFLVPRRKGMTIPPPATEQRESY